MNYIIRSRRGGKTHSLMTALGQDPTAIILVPTGRMAFELAKHYPTAKCRIVPWSQREQAVWGTTGPVGIDNLDIILQMETCRMHGLATTGGGLR